MQFSKLAHITGGLLSPEDLGCRSFSGVSIDSRTLQKGDLFIAISGERFDGHDFCEQAIAKGASGLVVSRVPQNLKGITIPVTYQDTGTARISTRDATHVKPRNGVYNQYMSTEASVQQSRSLKGKRYMPIVQVKDTKAALGHLAAVHRRQFTLPTIAITGSCGKTTTRALIAQILAQQAETLSSIKSFNNDIGVPLTLLRLNSSHGFAVLEVGANHLGEIEPLSHMIAPTVAVITCIGQAHLAGFGSLEGVCRAKGEIFAGLANHGTAILNADDPFRAKLVSLLQKHHASCAKNIRIVRFGMSNTADVYAKNIEYNLGDGTRFTLVTPKGSAIISLPLLGKHNVYNALAAAACADAVGVSVRQIQQGLMQVPVLERRLKTYSIHSSTQNEDAARISMRDAAHVKPRSGVYNRYMSTEASVQQSRSLKGEWDIAENIRLIDDSYNANPTALQAAIAVLAKSAGKKILVLGDMLELGEQAKAAHSAAGWQAKQAGIDCLYAYGNYSKFAAEAFGKCARHFTDQKTLLQSLKAEFVPPATVLVKGSRAMQMDRIVQALTEIT